MKEIYLRREEYSGQKKKKTYKGRQAGKNNMAIETGDIALTTRVMFVEMQ